MYMVTVRPASIRQTVGVFANFVNLQGLGDIYQTEQMRLKSARKKLKERSPTSLYPQGMIWIL